MKLAQINVKIEQVYRDQLQSLSEATGIPQAQLVRRALSSFLTRYGYWEEVWEKADSGSGDVKALDHPQTPEDG